MRILIVDDEPAMHDSYRRCFAPAARDETLHAMAGELFGDVGPEAEPTDAFEFVHHDQGLDAVAAVERARAEDRPFAVAFIDIRMPPTHSTEGLDTARLIRAELPEIAIVVLSAHVVVEQAMDLLAGGQRSSYLLKNRVTDVEEFVDTLERIVRGGSVSDPALLQELVAARASRSAWVAELLEDIDPADADALEQAVGALERLLVAARPEAPLRAPQPV